MCEQCALQDVCGSVSLYLSGRCFFYGYNCINVCICIYAHVIIKIAALLCLYITVCGMHAHVATLNLCVEPGCTPTSGVLTGASEFSKRKTIAETPHLTDDRRKSLYEGSHLSRFASPQPSEGSGTLAVPVATGLYRECDCAVDDGTGGIRTHQPGATLEVE